jgi:hypothetical protein
MNISCGAGALARDLCGDTRPRLSVECVGTGLCRACPEQLSEAKLSNGSGASAARLCLCGAVALACDLCGDRRPRLSVECVATGLSRACPEQLSEAKLSNGSGRAQLASIFCGAGAPARVG